MKKLLVLAIMLVGISSCVETCRVCEEEVRQNSDGSITRVEIPGSCRFEYCYN